jgi:hypothetical protein
LSQTNKQTAAKMPTIIIQMITAKSASNKTENPIAKLGRSNAQRKNCERLASM